MYSKDYVLFDECTNVFLCLYLIEFSMKKLSKSSETMLVLFAGIVIFSASSFSMNEALAKPHASLLIPPPEGQPDVNTIKVVLGHTNEPTFGKLPGIEDGKHYLEVELSDDATTLPIRTATLFADKFYFKNVESFDAAQSPQDADEIESNVPISAVFGSPGLFYNRQVVDPGIYGYTLRGEINYFDVGTVPIEDTTIFCNVEVQGAQEPNKFNSQGWTGAYGCSDSIKEIFFPQSQDKPFPHPPNYPRSDSYEEYPENYQPSSEY